MNANQKVVTKLLGVIVVMGGLAWASVPFYDWFCRVTGFGGTTQVAEQGSDVVLEQADIVLTHDRLERILEALDISKRCRKIIRQNLMISLGVVVLLGVAALGSWIPLPLGVLGHEGSTILVVANSLRLLFRQKEELV